MGWGFAPKSNGKISRARYASYVLILLISAVLLYFLLVRDLRTFRVPSPSMEPTLQPGDYIMTLGASDYRRGDIVVLEDPSPQGRYLVKRIVGVAGDRVAVWGGVLHINGKYASEPYVPKLMVYQVSPVKIQPGTVFVLGDNRNQSEDSTYFGAVAVETLIGKVAHIYLPRDRMGSVRHYPLTDFNGE